VCDSAPGAGQCAVRFDVFVRYLHAHSGRQCPTVSDQCTGWCARQPVWMLGWRWSAARSGHAIAKRRRTRRYPQTSEIHHRSHNTFYSPCILFFTKIVKYARSALSFVGPAVRSDRSMYIGNRHTREARGAQLLKKAENQQPEPRTHRTCTARNLARSHSHQPSDLHSTTQHDRVRIACARTRCGVCV
jgi:hypothetical protein